MRPSAAEYRKKAAQMRKSAADARDPTARQELLNVAHEYDKLAGRAEVAERGTKS